jgi:hypothetical protein
MAVYDWCEIFGVGRGWAVLPMRAQCATIATEAWSVTQNPARQERSTRQRCDRDAAEMSAELGSNPVSPTDISGQVPPSGTGAVLH